MKRAILIKSCNAFQSRQYSCWRTWAGGLAGGDAFVRIVVGGYEKPVDASFVFGVPSGDSYSDNSIKLREGIRQFLYRDDFDWLFICDDDTFICPQRWLGHEPDGDMEGRLYQPDAKQSKSLGGDPWINGGAGWYMSRTMCELYINQCAKKTSADDVVASRIAQRNRIKIIDRPDLYGESRYSDSPKVAADNSLITCHPCNPQEMARLFESIK